MCTYLCDEWRTRRQAALPYMRNTRALVTHRYYDSYKLLHQWVSVHTHMHTDACTYRVPSVMLNLSYTYGSCMHAYPYRVASEMPKICGRIESHYDQCCFFFVDTIQTIHAWVWTLHTKLKTILPTHSLTHLISVHSRL